MAWSKLNAGTQILRFIQQSRIEVDPREANQLKQEGYAHICGFCCKAANVLGTSSFRVTVCTDWFRGSSDAKPSINTSRVGFDYQLLPTRKYLFAIYYLALRDYALQLEKDRAHWFDEPYWGMLVDEDHGVFTWKGGNTKHFPLLVVSSPLDLELRAKQYHAQRETYMSPSA